jgi:hypothetical protein
MSKSETNSKSKGSKTPNQEKTFEFRKFGLFRNSDFVLRISNRRFPLEVCYHLAHNLIFDCLMILTGALQKLRKSLHPVPGHLARIREFENFGRAVEDALRVSLAEVAFSGNPFDGVQGHGPYGTSIYAHGTSDTDVLLNFHHSLGVRALEGPGGTYVHAGRFFAVQAGDWYILPLAEGDDLNPSPPGIPHPMMVQGTDQFTHPATTANVLRVLTVFKVANPLSAQLILRT